MKKEILPAIKLTILCIVLLAVLYPLVVWGIAQFSDGQGKGQKIEQDGKSYYSNIGQAFTQDEYFWSRPSSVDYNAAGSGGSNKGPSNAEYLQIVEDRIDTFLVHNPTVQRSQIPVELVTASASGLDPHITLKSAMIQIDRIAKQRNIQVEKVEGLVNEHQEGAFLGLFGPKKINVLKLNLALDQLK